MKNTEQQSKQTVFITGASSGIGKATAEFFADRGWNVVATMRSPEKAGDIAERENVLALACDVVDEVSVQHAVTVAQEHFGKIDVLVNNAGYGLTGPFESTDEEHVRRQFEVNVFGVQRMIRAVLPEMRKRRDGCIVNIASVGGRMAFPLYSNYHATKWAVDGFSESVQYELAVIGVRVKVVEPGPVATDFYGRSMDVHDDGGIEEYRAFVEKVGPQLTGGGVNGARPEEIAATIYKAATDRGRRLRYPAGRTGKLLLMLRRALPDRLFFWIMRRSVLKGV